MRAWTTSEVEFLLINNHMTNEQIAKKLNRTINSVEFKKKDLRNKGVCAVYTLPEDLSQQEKESRIIKLAADMRVKLKGW